MTWGFEATNSAGQVLVSSETRNLHFVGKATLNRVINRTDGIGGMRHLAYWIDCEVTPMPFFSMPTENFYGVVCIRSIKPYPNRKTWEIELIRSGTSTVYPEVYVFSDPRGVVNHATNYGMMVMRDDGTPSFDSRLQPLVVSGGTLVTTASNPRIAGPGGLSPYYCGTNDYSSFTPDNQNTFSFAMQGGKPIYFYPSIAQAQREFGVSASSEECTGVDAYNNCVGYKTVKLYRSYYWTFYRAGIKHVGNSLFCGWIPVSWACNWKYNENNELIGIGVDGGSGEGGTWPYSNETINHLTPTAVITANGALYD